jgi:hypothetical protein
VGSLPFFLVHVFQQGQFEARLLFVLAMFVLAIVCITRIAMEEGQAYATLYAFPIAILVGIALARFVEIRGPLAAFSGPINWTLMAIVWAAAHRLTWDCTLIDDSQDASGAGLLAQMGLDEEGAASGTGTPALEAISTTAAAPVRPANRQWWQDWLEPDRSPHPPGVWVVIFSLAALPIFGIGGRFIPEGDLDVRRRCFWLLVVYVASGMSLLLATSFLGLRRYLRQRRLEMPLEMAAAWIGAGLVLILGTLIVASLLPRPSPEYSLAHLVQIDSLERKASRFAYGPEGGKSDPDHPSSSGTEQQKGQQADQSGGNKTDPKNQSGAPTKSGNGKGGQSQSGAKGGNSKGGEKGGSKSGQSGDKQGQSDDSQRSKGDNADNKSGDQSGGDKSKSSPDNQKSAGRGQQGKSQQSASEQPSDQQQQDQSQADQQSSQHGASSSQSDGGAMQQMARHALDWFGSLGGILKAIFYLAIAIALGVIAWKYRAQLLAAWKKLLAELQDLWAKWFGRPAAADAEQPADVAPQPRRFAEFADPFAGGQSSRMSPAELVRYTFQALEAWGRDNDCPRADGQTAHEFAAAIGQYDHDLAREAQHLADLYSRLAYAPPAAIRTTFEPLRSLWQKLRSQAVVA